MAMKSARPSPLNRQVIEEAAAWFVEFRVDDDDARARHEFSLWVRRSPEHIRAYLEICDMYVSLPSCGFDERSIEQLIARVRGDINVVPLGTAARPGPKAPKPLTRRLFNPAALLVCLLALGVGGWSAWRYVSQSRTYATQTGEKRSITLADGSTVELNERSEVRVRFTAHERGIDLLQGEALFRVTKDNTRPFIVEADRTRVHAVGTQFHVHRTAAATTITVLEGRVAVSPPESRDAVDRVTARAITKEQPADEILLGVGEQVTVTAQRVLPPTRSQLVAAAPLTQREIVFDASRLIRIVEQINRHSRRQIVIDDARLEDMLISGVYASTDPASLVLFLRAQPGIVVVETDTQIHITSQ